MTQLEASIVSITGALARQFSIDYTLDLQFGGCGIRVNSNSHLLISDLKDYFGSFTCDGRRPDIEIIALEAEPPRFGMEFTIKQPDPGKTKIKEEFIDLPDGRIVRKRLTGMVFLFGGDIHMAAGLCTENSNQVVNFINNRYIQWLLRRGCLLGHAAGVVNKKTGLALAGFSGMGKSTLALHLMNHNLNFVSNDRLLVQSRAERVIMLGVPKQPRINPGTILANDTLTEILPDDEREDLETIPAADLWSLEQKYDVMIDEVYGEDRFDLEAPMDALVILNWQRTNEPALITRVDLEARRDLLGAFIKAPGLFYEKQSRSLDFSEEAYISMLRPVKVFEITGGTDFEQATHSCLEIME